MNDEYTKEDYMAMEVLDQSIERSERRRSIARWCRELFLPIGAALAVWLAYGFLSHSRDVDTLCALVLIAYGFRAMVWMIRA